MMFGFFSNNDLDVEITGNHRVAPPVLKEFKPENCFFIVIQSFGLFCNSRHSLMTILSFSVVAVREEKKWLEDIPYTLKRVRRFPSFTCREHLTEYIKQPLFGCFPLFTHSLIKAG